MFMSRKVDDDTRVLNQLWKKNLHALTHFTWKYLHILTFSIFFQELEQEKYHLRRRLQAAEEEYELRVNELQADINSLRKSLEEATTAQRQSEKEKSLLITNLTEQNQRLTSQLKEVRFFVKMFQLFGEKTQ